VIFFHPLSRKISTFFENNTAMDQSPLSAASKNPAGTTSLSLSLSLSLQGASSA